MQANDEDETEEHKLERQEQSRKKRTERVAHGEPSSMKPSIKEFTKFDGNTTSYAIDGITAKARIPIEQDVDLILKNEKFKIFGQPQDEVLLTTDRRFNHLRADEESSIFKNGLLLLKYHGELVTSNTAKF